MIQLLLFLVNKVKTYNQANFITTLKIVFNKFQFNMRSQAVILLAILTLMHLATYERTRAHWDH